MKAKAIADYERLAAISRRAMTMQMFDINELDPLDPVHLRNNSRDHDKHDERGRGEDLDVFPQQHGGSR